MNILVLGGTRYFGVHLVNELLLQGHQVTIATRGIAKDNFGDKVTRIKVDRNVADDLKLKLLNLKFDVVYDNINYCSNDTKALLDAVNTNRYIVTSSGSVYKGSGTFYEDDFNSLTYPLKWCNRDDYPYDEVKRQMECATFQPYKIPSVAVRFPIVLGIDDYTKRLYFYVENIMKSKSINITGEDFRISFIDSREAGRFLAFLASSDKTGTVNAANDGIVHVKEIVSYIERKTGIKAIIDANGADASFNYDGDFVLSTNKAQEWDYEFESLDSFLYKLIDEYIVGTMG